MISEAKFKALIKRSPFWIKPEELIQLSGEQHKSVHRIVEMEKKTEANRKARLANDKAEMRTLEAATVAQIIAQQLGLTASKLEQIFRVLPDTVFGLKTIEETRKQTEKAHEQLLESFREQWDQVRKFTIKR